MFNPLVQGLSDLTDQQLQQKIAEISQKYALVRNMNNLAMLSQIATVLDTYKQEVLNRTYAKQKEAEAQQGSKLDPFASLDIK